MPTATASSTAGVSIANNSLLSFAGPGIAISAWLINDGSDVYGWILTQQNTAGFFIHNGILLWGGFGADVAATTNFSSILHHVGASGDGGGNVNFYLDGKLDRNVAVSAQTNTIGFNTMFNDTSSETFIGKIFVLMIWHRILTAMDFWDLYYEPWRLFLVPRPQAVGLKAGAVGGGTHRFFFGA